MSTLHKADCTLHWSALGWSPQPGRKFRKSEPSQLHQDTAQWWTQGWHCELVKYSSQSRVAPFYRTALLAALWLWKLALISPSISPLSPCHLVSAIPFTKCPALSVCMLIHNTPTTYTNIHYVWFQHRMSPGRRHISLLTLYWAT